MQVFTRSIKLIVASFFLFTCYITAQAPAFNWAKTFGSDKLDYGNAITVDASGNIYLTGEFYNTVDFGSSVILTSVGFMDYYLVKFDANGNAIWGTSGGGSLTDRGYGVVVDNNGDVVVTGHYYGIATFGDTSLTSDGNLDAFTAKYDGSGNMKWIKEGKDVSQVSTRGIAVDGSNNYYIAGYFGKSTSPTVKFDNVTLISKGNRDIFLVKYDVNGNVKWGVSAGSPQSGEEAKDVAVDGNGNVYIIGMFVDTAYFGAQSVISKGGSDIFVAKYDTDGNLIWVKSAGSPLDDVGYGVTGDNLGHIYISGRFDSVATFGNKDYKTNGGLDAFVAKMDVNGNFIWVDTFGGTGTDNCLAVKTDAAGYCTGYGTFEDIAGFGTTTFTSAGAADIFYVNLDPDGNVVWDKQAGGIDKDAATGLAVEGNGNIVSTGYFSTSASFDAFQFNSNGAQDIFLNKLGATVVPVELISLNAVISNNAVFLKWSTATETNNSGFAIERSTDNKSFEEIGFVDGKGTSAQRNDYSFTDEKISGSKYYYRLKQMDFDGAFKYSSIVEVNMNVPASFSLYQNYPNPFNPSTNIVFDLPVASKVTITIYNSIGKEMEVITNKEYQAGKNEIRFDASSYASGIYYYRLNAYGNNGSIFSSNRKMILLR